MKMKLFFFLLSSLTIVLTGCKTQMRDFGYDKPYEFTSKDVRRYKYLDGKFREAYDQALKNKDWAKAKIERDQILGELMYLIEASHGDYERSMRFHKTTFDVITDFTLLGLTGAGAVTGGAETKAILAAVATGVKGAELSVNTRLFKDQTIEAIQAQMRAAQAQRKEAILRRIDKPATEYTLELGLSDIVQYYYDGTLTRAFQNLVADAKEKEKKAEVGVTKALLSKATPEQIQNIGKLTDMLDKLVTAGDRAKAIQILKAMPGGFSDDPKIADDEIFIKLQDKINEATTNPTLLKKLNEEFNKN